MVTTIITEGAIQTLHKIQKYLICFSFVFWLTHQLLRPQARYNLEIRPKVFCDFPIFPKCYRNFSKTFRGVFRIGQEQPPEVFYKKAVLKIFTIFTENTCVGVSFSIKLFSTQVFSCEYC